MTDGIELELALDEALVRTGDGGGQFHPLHPPATPASLGVRLSAVAGEPVAYPPGAERNEGNRRVITRELSVKPGSADLGRILERHALSLKERPDYAPGWVILSASDPLAALAVLDEIRATDGVIEADLLVGRHRFKRSLPDDPLVAQQWHLSNNNSTRTHANVEEAWNFGGSAGVRGGGIRIGIIDDGIERTHPDLLANLDTANGWDFLRNNDDPSPSIPGDDHGTPCAGVAAARGNNSLGVSGVAPEASLVALRLISASTITDAQEAAAIAWKNEIIQIKSNSWGPADDGVTLGSERPGGLLTAAFANATSAGRGGRGTIIVWAGGNGLRNNAQDNSNYDGYANSIHTIAVGASNSAGTRAFYSEPGANLVVCAPSDGTISQLGITTTDLTGSPGYNTASGPAGNFTGDFGGTSATAPAVAGVVALMLQKNPDLGWRDVQEILIRSAHKISPTDSAWSDNGAGFHFHHHHGAGLVDASSAVSLAEAWYNLGPRNTVSSTQSGLSIPIPDNQAEGIITSFAIAEDLRVEHVTVCLDATHSNHRQLEITLTSPSGMVSRLGTAASGKSGEPLNNWTFSSVRHWGEHSQGEWTVGIADTISGTTGSLTLAELNVFGTPWNPVNQAPRITAVTLSENGIGYTDTALAVSSISAYDPEGDGIEYQYQWQWSSDAVSFVADPAETSASLGPSPSRSGKLWRCVATASDGISASEPFTSAAVNLLARPPATAAPGEVVFYQSGLVLAPNPDGITRMAIINEFSHGPAGGTSGWVEILKLQDGGLRDWKLRSKSRTLSLKDSALWDQIPAGTRIVIYNGKVAKDPLLPADDVDASDGCMVVSSTDALYFNADSNHDQWLDLDETGDFIELFGVSGNRIHGLSYGSNGSILPYLGAVGSGQSACFTGDRDTLADMASSWMVITHAQATPGSGNSPANSAFAAALADGSLSTPARFRLADGVVLPDGLTLDEVSGVLSGRIYNDAPAGDHPITIERYNSTPAVVSQCFTLAIRPPRFEDWIASFPQLADHSPGGDPDHDGLPNLVEYALALDPRTSETPSPLAFGRDAASIHLSYRISKLRDDVVLVPERAEDMTGPWTSEGLVTSLLAEDPDSELRRATLAIDPGLSRCFLRLRATLDMGD
jgi:subtilisin-like proprotein convertase family protein